MAMSFNCDNIILSGPMGMQELVSVSVKIQGSSVWKTVSQGTSLVRCSFIRRTVMIAMP